MNSGNQSLENDFGPGTLDPAQATTLARVLALAAQVTGVPVTEETAWFAVNEHDSYATWQEVACHAAEALGLHTQVTRGLPTYLSRAQPALGRTSDGRWLLLTRRRGRRLRVLEVLQTGLRRRWQTRAQVQAQLDIDTGDWVHIHPLFPLDRVSRLRRPHLKNSPWKRLRAFLQLERADIGVILVYAIVIGGLTLGTPVAVQSLVNTVAFGAVLQPLVVLSILLFAVLAFAGVLSVLEAYVIEVLQRRIFVRIAGDFGRRIPAAARESFDATYGPELVNRFLDVIIVQKTLATLLIDGLSLALQTILGMVLLGFYHPVLLAFDVILIVLLFGVLALGRGAVASGSLESTAKYQTAAWLQDIARSSQLFHGSQARRYAAMRTEMLCHSYLSARKQHFQILLRQLTGGIGLQVLAMVALLGAGGYLVIDRQLTLGQLVAAELVITMIGAGFVKLGKTVEKLYDLNVGVLKLSNVIDLEPERSGGATVSSSGPLPLALRGVSLTRGRTWRNLNLEVRAGERVLLTGPAGSGKSTVLEVMAGVRRCSGVVLLAGNDTRRVDLANLRNEIALVTQPTFFNGSVLDNICVGRSAPNEPEIRLLLQQTGLETAVDGLPQGLDTTLLPNGAPLSQTQARRLALVRALASRPGLLFLDGALDGLGLSLTQRENLLDAILGPDAPWTVMVVSTCPMVAKRCQRHIRLRDDGMEDVT